MYLYLLNTFRSPVFPCTTVYDKDGIDNQNKNDANNTKQGVHT